MEVTVKFLTAAVVISSVSLIANIVGVVIPYWAYASQSDATAARGLWHRCDIRSDSETITCFAAYNTVPVYVHAVRALEITGIALAAVALGCGVLKLLVWKDKNILAKFATGFSCAAGVFILLGIIIFVAKFVEESDAITEIHYGLSVGFGLCVASGVLAFAAGTMYIISFLKKRL